jgi:molybdopterin-guanine dinucleotide biosynthesis protein A
MRSLLLAGGKSSRMGKDKAMIEVDGECCISRVVNALYSSNEKPVRIAVSNTEYIKKYSEVIDSKINIEWVVDENQYAGPIESITENLEDPEFLKEDFIQLSTVDVPWVTNDFFNCLKSSIKKEDDVLIPTDGENIHPLLSLIRPEVVLNKLKEGSKKPLSIQFCEINYSLYQEDLKILKNVNYPQDLE